MQAKSFRLKAATLGIHSTNDGFKIPVTVPIGATVVITGGPLNGNRLADVVWEDKRLMMFTQDLRDRAQEVKRRDVAQPRRLRRTPPAARKARKAS